ncbi:MAG: dockerin type I domain-containing protein [Pyrinomonadaceae bacterium]
MESAGGGGQRDIARAGRGFAPLEVGQTLKVVIDNPSETLFFRGYFVRLSGSTGGVNGNTCYNGMGCTPGAAPKEKMRFQSFEYFNYGQWGLAFGDGPDPNTDPDFTNTGLFNADSVTPLQVGTDSGVRLEVKLTGPETFEAKMIPLDNVGATFTRAGPLANPGFSIDWIEFLHFNTQSEVGFDTDFFIRSMEIVDGIGANNAYFDGDGDVDGGDYLKWQRGVGLTGQTNNSNGDANGDGSVAAADLSIWRTQFGVGPLVAAATAIPEPTCFSLLLAAGLVPLRFGRRARVSPVAVRGYSLFALVAGGPGWRTRLPGRRSRKRLS